MVRPELETDFNVHLYAAAEDMEAEFIQRHETMITALANACIADIRGFAQKCQVLHTSLFQQSPLTESELAARVQPLPSLFRSPRAMQRHLELYEREVRVLRFAIQGAADRHEEIWSILEDIDDEDHSWERLVARTHGWRSRVDRLVQKLESEIFLLKVTIRNRTPMLEKIAANPRKRKHED